MTKGIRLLLSALLLLFFLCGCQIQGEQLENIQVKNGGLDLSAWNFSKQGNVPLDGNWAFYWDKLISPGEFGNESPTGYYDVPSYWTKYKSLSLPSYGCATYRLIIKTDGVARSYSILTPELYTEYALWVNGSLVDANGSFANEETRYLHPQVYDFYANCPDMEIVLQIKNNAHLYGGIGQSIKLGSLEQIHRERDSNEAVDLILISICLSAGFYYLILFLFRRSSREFICFFVLCISVSLRNFISNTTLIMQIFPDLPFWLGSKIVTLTIPAVLVSMLFYTRRLFQNEMPQIAFHILMSINLLYASLVLFTAPGIYSSVFTFYLLTVGAACALGVYVSVKAVIRRKKESVFFFAGILFLASGALMDSLRFIQVIPTKNVLSASLFCFIIIQVTLLAKRYAEAYRRTELLSDDLQASIDKIMNTETAYLSAQMKPHFLYNALTVIAESCETDPAEAGRLILSLSKYLRQTLDYEMLSGIVPLKKELDLVHAYTTIERARFSNIEIIFDFPDPLPFLHLPPLTLQPLVENAIKHGLRKKREGGRVIVTAKQQENSLLFNVEDNGVGIPDDVLKNVAVMPNGSVNIGLYNINTRLLRRYGTGLMIKSKTGFGTSISFEIPYREDY